MNVSRETIYAALFALLTEAAGFHTVSRVPLPVADIPNANFPVLEQLAAREDATSQGLNLPLKWSIKVQLMVYANTANVPNTDAALNALLDSIETALAPNKATGYQTLGGLVTQCKIFGSILKDAGFQSGIGAAAIAIELVTTS